MVNHFIALFDVWIDANTSDLVRVDVRSSSVTANLCDARYHIHRPTRVFELWKDALCINRGDNKNGLSQVVMMMKIYGAPSRAAMYLGTPLPEEGWPTPRDGLPRASLYLEAPLTISLKDISSVVLSWNGLVNDLYGYCML
ncbi:uncharacterized protein EAF01_002347 [Botrytis porri]|uniref:uncharacterized protein n=1 Tax=Botrytis porri TaxID=87229 RepID=UPI0018FF958A|nr:uncharacterized protein EAF01_002347 [Botrytis porri]KAF7910838.1 hypothetical protein EAF01_002347 [Botrytis porri]